MNQLLQVDQLSVTFSRRNQNRVALKQVSLTLSPGERVGLVGESGSGKSLTALAIAGLLPDNAQVSGQVLLAGVDMLRAPDREAARLRGKVVSLVFQEPMSALDPTMTVGRQLAEVVRLHPSGRQPGQTREKVQEMFAAVGLPVAATQSFPHQLSGGQRQRVVLAMALINDPALIVCDEPTTALDVRVQAQVLGRIREHLDDHQAGCLFIGHDLAVVAQMCDRILVMRSGEIVESGPTRKIFSTPEHPYTQGLVATSRLEQIAPGARLPTLADFEQADLEQADFEQADLEQAESESGAGDD